MLENLIILQKFGVNKVLAKFMTKACDRLCASKSLTEIPFERRSSLKGQRVGKHRE